MDVKTLANTPAWEWPSDAGDVLLAVLRDAHAPTSDRATAAQLAGDLVVMDDEMAAVLLSILKDAGEAEEVRGNAAIALGPVLEEGDVQGFEDVEEMPISEHTFRTIRKSLHALFTDDRVPGEVRRRVLEASVRAPEPWHAEAVRKAWAGNDVDWKITALFGMGFVPGFDDEILAALESPNADLRYEAVVAAGRREVDAAWPHIRNIVHSKHPDKDLLLAAIDAAPGIRPDETADLLEHLLDARDEEIAAAAGEAISMARGLSGEYDEDDDEVDVDEEEEEEDEDDEPEDN